MEALNRQRFADGKRTYARSEIAETLYRWAAGMDFGDEDLLTSAFTEDVVFDILSIDMSIRSKTSAYYRSRLYPRE